jgi:hypothetical protein
MNHRPAYYVENGFSNRSQDDDERSSFLHWKNNKSSLTASVETEASPTDKYELADFARDDFPRFCELVEHLSPRDAEIMHCFAVLQMRPTDLSILFGKAGHRAEEDLHKAAHKLAGLIQFGIQPTIEQLATILDRLRLGRFQSHSFAACIWQYARTRDFLEVSKLIGQRGLRQQMLRAFKILHASEDREAGLLAGWILWLVDGSDPKTKGWQKRQRHGREHKLGPTSFSTKIALKPEQLLPRATGRGGQGQRPDTVKISRRMKFCLRGETECL